MERNNYNNNTEEEIDRDLEITQELEKDEDEAQEPSDVVSQEPGETVYEEESEEEQAENENEPEEEPQEEVAKKDKRRNNSLRDSYSQLQREKFQFLDLITKQQEEIERLKQEYSMSSRSAEYHHDLNVKERIKTARQNLIAAKEAGDYAAEADAQLELGLATAELNNLNSWKAQQKLAEQQNEQYYSPQQMAIDEIKKNNRVQKWAAENPWMDPRNEEYDPWLSQQAELWTAQWNKNLEATGNERFIYSDDYLERLNYHISELNRKRRKTYNTGDLGMKSSKRAAAPVRSASRGAAGNGVNSNLNKFDEEMIELLGVNKKNYEKRKDLRIAKDRRENRNEDMGAIRR